METKRFRKDREYNSIREQESIEMIRQRDMKIQGHLQAVKSLTKGKN